MASRGLRIGFSSEPAWLAGVPLNEWIEIPGTSGAGGSAIDAYSGFALKQSTAEIIIALAGGHNDSSDNRVTSISILADDPSAVGWVLRNAGSANSNPPRTPNTPYYTDGLPASRHTRYQCLYCEPLDKLILLGSPSLYGGSVLSDTESNGFDLVTNTWDATGTWASTSVASVFGSCLDDLGNIWCRGQRWNWATDDFQSSASFPRNPGVFDPVRRHTFWFAFGDGSVWSSTLTAKRISEDGATVSDITINSSAAYTEFQALQAVYTALE